jgi:serine/threonine protein phosphatase PrpC
MDTLFGTHTQKGVGATNQDSITAFQHGHIKVGIVADGHGTAGHTASSAIIQQGTTFCQNFISQNETFTDDHFRTEMRRFFQEIHIDVCRLCGSGPGAGGATLTIIFKLPTRVLVANAGDSPAYLLQGSDIKCISSSNSPTDLDTMLALQARSATPITTIWDRRLPDTYTGPLSVIRCVYGYGTALYPIAFDGKTVHPRPDGMSPCTMAGGYPSRMVAISQTVYGSTVRNPTIAMATSIGDTYSHMFAGVSWEPSFSFTDIVEGSEGSIIFMSDGCSDIIIPHGILQFYQANAHLSSSTIATNLVNQTLATITDYCTRYNLQPCQLQDDISVGVIQF